MLVYLKYLKKGKTINQLKLMFQISIHPDPDLEFLFYFLESKFTFSAYISPFYLMMYNSKTWIGTLITDLDSKLKLEF